MPLDIEKSFSFLISKAHQRIHAYFRDHLSPYNLTPQQFSLLAFLWQEDCLSQAQLAQRSDIDRTTLSGLIDRLEKQKLVTRQPRPGDRRAYLVALTEEGEALQNILAPVAMNMRQHICANLQPGEYEQLCGLLTKLLSHQK